MGSIRYIAIALLAGLIIGGGAYLYTMFKPHRNVEREKPDFRLTADELFEAFEQDEAQANAKYLDKVIEVRGKVQELSQSAEGSISIILTAASAMLGGVNGELTEKWNDQAAKLSPGDDVTMKCRCTGMTMEVVMKECSLIEG